MGVWEVEHGEAGANKCTVVECQVTREVRDQSLGGGGNNTGGGGKSNFTPTATKRRGGG